MNTPTPDRPTVAVIGGGYGGTSPHARSMTSLTLSSSSPATAFVHNIGALRAVVDPDFAPRIFLPYNRLFDHGRVIRDRAAQVSADRVVLGSGDEIRPDYLVLATGSSYPFPAKSDVDDAAAATGEVPRPQRRACRGRFGAPARRRPGRHRAGGRDHLRVAQSSFTRWFISEFGMAPAKWRRLMRRRDVAHVRPGPPEAALSAA